MTGRQVPWLERSIHWDETQDSLAPWAATVDGHALELRLGDFPAEPMYTLVVDGVDVQELESFPVNWTRGTRP